MKLPGWNTVVYTMPNQPDSGWGICVLISKSGIDGHRDNLARGPENTSPSSWDWTSRWFVNYLVAAARGIRETTPY